MKQIIKDKFMTTLEQLEKEFKRRRLTWGMMCYHCETNSSVDKQLADLWSFIEKAYGAGRKEERNEVKEKLLKMDTRTQKDITWECPHCGQVGEEGKFCKNDRRKLVKKVFEWIDDTDEAYNQCLEEVYELLIKIK